MIETNKELLEKIAKAGLECVTTKRQEKRGTQMYVDPQTGTFYGVYSTGYVRRVYRYGEKKYPWSKYEEMYPVNKRKTEKRKDTEGHVIYTHESYVMVPNLSDRVSLMLEAVENHRRSRKIDTLRQKFPELSNRCIIELAKKNYAYFSKD